jgi:hypothetical protein
MKTISFFIIAILAILFVQTAIAQTEKLGAIQYSAPQGWARAAMDSYGHLLIPAPTRQLTLADIVGQWGESDGINVTYVNRYSGTYAATDSLHYKSKMTFTADGGYYNDFYAIQNGKMIKDKTAGKISINGRLPQRALLF